MRKVGSSDDVKVAAFVKQLQGGGAHHMIVGKDGQGEVEEDVGDKDSGSPQTMLDFIRWAHEKAPAERYALVVWNHGSGWDPLDFDQLYSEVRAARGRNGFNPRELADRSRTQIARSVFTSSVVEVLLARDDAAARDRHRRRQRATRSTRSSSRRVIKKAREDARRAARAARHGRVPDELPRGRVRGRARPARRVVGSEELEPDDGWPYAEILARPRGQPRHGRRRRSARRS